jgi:hypothetical protein
MRSKRAYKSYDTTPAIINVAFIDRSPYVAGIIGTVFLRDVDSVCIWGNARHDNPTAPAVDDSISILGPAVKNVVKSIEHRLEWSILT